MAGLFTRGVFLSMDAGQIHARSAGDLRASLAAYVPLSAARLAELGTLGDRALALRAVALEGITDALVEGLTADAEAPARLLAWVQEQDVALDRQWADALAAARRWDGDAEPFQRALLEALAEHLRGERECVRTLIANRDRGLISAGEAAAAARQRMVLNVTALLGAGGPLTDFERLPKGEPLEIPMAPGQALELKFAQHRFLVVCGVPWLLIDDVGEDLRLQPGRNVAGRSSECEAVLHESYRTISRRHAVLDVHGTERLVLTDMSSLGTFVPRVYLDSRLH